MQKGRRLSKAQRRKKFKEICAEYGAGGVTLASVCGAFDIDDRTFYRWIKDDETEAEKAGNVSEMSELFKKAKKDADQFYQRRIEAKAKTALERKLDGYETTELHQVGKMVSIPDPAGGTVVTAEGIKPKMIKVFEAEGVKQVKKIVAPDTTMIIFTLKNVASEDFKDSKYIEHTGKGGGEIKTRNLGDMSFEQLYELKHGRPPTAKESGVIEEGDKHNTEPPPLEFDEEDFK